MIGPRITNRTASKASAVISPQLPYSELLLHWMPLQMIHISFILIQIIYSFGPVIQIIYPSASSCKPKMHSVSGWESLVNSTASLDQGLNKDEPRNLGTAQEVENHPA